MEVKIYLCVFLLQVIICSVWSQTTKREVVEIVTTVQEVEAVVTTTVASVEPTVPTTPKANVNATTKAQDGGDQDGDGDQNGDGGDKDHVDDDDDDEKEDDENDSDLLSGGQVAGITIGVIIFLWYCLAGHGSKRTSVDTQSIIYCDRNQVEIHRTTCLINTGIIGLLTVRSEDQG